MLGLNSKRSSRVRVADIDEEFKRELVDLVPTLLSPENLVEKEIGGVKITCRELLHYFKVSLFPFQPKVVSQDRHQGLSADSVRPWQVKG